jgi:hypothetical protein
MRAHRTIAHHEAAQLRTTPVRLWPYVHQEAKAMRLLLARGGRVRVVALTVDERTRIA